MGLLKSLGDKLEEAREELGEKLEEKKRAAQLAAMEKAAGLALRKGVEAARGAVAETGKRIEEALFGDDEAPPAEAEPARDAPAPNAHPAEPRGPTAEERSDRFEREVDEELEALKRKVARER